MQADRSRRQTVYIQYKYVTLYLYIYVMFAIFRFGLSITTQSLLVVVRWWLGDRRSPHFILPLSAAVGRNVWETIATLARGKYKLLTFPLPTQNGSSMKTLFWTPCCSIGSLSWVRRICFPLYHCSARGELMLLMEVFVLTASLSSVITDPLHTDSARWRDSEVFWQQQLTILLMGVITLMMLLFTIFGN